MPFTRTFDGDGVGGVRVDMGAVEAQTAGGAASANFGGSTVVNGFDFLLWQRGLGITSGASQSDGDATFDGAVTSGDLSVWELQYGTAAPIIETFLAVEPSTASQVDVKAALASTSEESVASRLPADFIVSPSDLGLGFRFTEPQQVLVKERAFTEHDFTEHVDEAFHGLWNSLPEQNLELASDDFVRETHGRSAKATPPADKAFAKLADDEGFVGQGPLL
jgi:hypothetical protein